MLTCNINLAKGIIWSRKKRLLAYRLLLVYLFIMLLLLIAVSALSAQKVIGGLQYFNQSRDLDQAFARTRPGDPSLHKYAEALKKQLEWNTARVESISEALPPVLHSPLPAFVLLANQSDKYSLHRLAFSQQTGQEPVRLSLDLITPQEQAAVSARAFQELWTRDPELSRQFPEIKQLQVRRVTLAEGPMQITQYEAADRD